MLVMLPVSSKKRRSSFSPFSRLLDLVPRGAGVDCDEGVDDRDAGVDS